MVRSACSSPQPPRLTVPAGIARLTDSHRSSAGGKTSVSEPDVVIRPPALDKEVCLALVQRQPHCKHVCSLDIRLDTAVKCR